MPTKGALKAVQESETGVVIRIDDELYQTLSRMREPGQSFNDVLRRQFGLPRKVKWVRKP